MNINGREYSDDDGVCGLTDDIEEHAEIMAQADPDLRLTGAFALISHPDPSLRQAGSMLVWLETEDDTWVHVNTEGEVVTALCPVSK